MTDPLDRLENELNSDAYKDGLMTTALTAVTIRAGLMAGGYSEYFAEKVGWLIFTQLYGSHITENHIEFEAPQGTYLTAAERTAAKIIGAYSVADRNDADGDRGTRYVQGDEGASR